MEATRTLVKSPPELWAELSDVAALTRHLGEFGEIRITRTEPESVVEWEGDRASGSVRLHPSGWGTRVTLTLEPIATPETPPGCVEPPALDSSDGVGAADVAEPRAPAEDTRVVDAPGTVEPADAVELEAVPRRGFFARLFRWRRRRAAAARAAEPNPVAEAEEAPAANASPGAAADPEPAVANDLVAAPEPELDATASPDPVDPSRSDPGEAGHAAAEAPPADPPPPEPDAAAILSQALDALGAAHHRPFSR